MLVICCLYSQICSMLSDYIISHSFPFNFKNIYLNYSICSCFLLWFSCIYIGFDYLQYCICMSLVNLFYSHFELKIFHFSPNSLKVLSVILVFIHSYVPSMLVSTSEMIFLSFLFFPELSHI